ncbi:SDR family oxidoreductase [Sediminibacterium soli]|uniref:SDR family oxidoreductase n=1 Tax=Sediminibacterium soli TaxID=2698829 RepID=UPI001379FF21|nr:SDR family oxidoreductase [Sediminibacterium soli]NCI45509.1 SDR family oxidoreductase [Sediminibacterium soli]
MSKKIALVTGANKGLGLETVKQLAKEGIKVIAGSRNPEKGLKSVEALQAQGLDVEFLQLDVDNNQDIRNTHDYILNRYGKLDILINNAGVQIESREWTTNTTESIDDTVLRSTLDTNFFNLVKLTNTLLPLIKKSAAGRIVNLSSILGSLGLHASQDSPIYQSKLFAYDTSKTALNSYTVHLAQSLANTTVKVNSAHPGWVKTDMGTEAAPMNINDGAKTSVALALLDENGPNGKFIHLGEELPW